MGSKEDEITESLQVFHWSSILCDDVMILEDQTKLDKRFALAENRRWEEKT
jgi:hypothetical protein